MKEQKITSQPKPHYKEYKYLGEKRQTSLSSQPQRSDKILEDERVLTNKKSTRVGFNLSVVALGIVGLVALTFLFWGFQSDNVLEIKNNPVPVRPTRINKDEYIILHYDYCKNNDMEGIIESQLISKTALLPLPPRAEISKKGCKVIDVPYPIPGQAPPETYHYYFKVCYQLNPIKKACTEWDSKEFIIEGVEPKKEIKITKV